MRVDVRFVILLMLSLATPRALGAPDEGLGPQAAAAAVARAVEKFEAKDYEGAAAAYKEAIDVRTGALEQEEGEQARAIRDLRSEADADHGAFMQKVSSLLTSYDRLDREIAQYELGLARARAHEGKASEASRAVGRALGGDLGLLDKIRANRDLKSIRKSPEYVDLMLRMERGQGRLTADDPIIDEVGRRDFRRCLKLAPGSTDLHRTTPIIGELFRIAVEQHDAEAPAELTLDNYVRLVRLGLLVPWSHGGWAYRHAHLYRGGDAIVRLEDEAYARFDKAKGQPAGAFWGFVAFFPALYLGQFKRVRLLLAYLEKHARSRYADAVGGATSVLDDFTKADMAFPGTSMADARALLKEMTAKDQDVYRERLTLRAWAGRPDAMRSLGHAYLYSHFGAENQARGFVWSQSAYRMGEQRAGMDLAWEYHGGFGVAKDFVKAFELSMEAAEAGNAEGMNGVGYAYHYGEGIKQDHAKAIEWYRKAAAKGHGAAAEGLGLLLQRGLGTEQDYAGARKAYEQAGKARNRRARRRLGNLSIDARQGAEDLQQATSDLHASLEILPNDMLSVVYLGTTLLLRKQPKKMRAMVKDALVKGAFKGAERALLLAMTHSHIDPKHFESKARKEKDEGRRKKFMGWINYLAGIQRLAKDKPLLARPYFERCVELNVPNDSVRFSAIAELKRLGPAGD